jgi:hypothetical protein
MRDVWMIERRQRLRFARESRQAIGIAGKGVRQDLQRDLTIELRVPRAVDLAHPARADRRDDFVRAETGASGQGHEAWLILVVVPLTAKEKGAPQQL